MNLSGGPWRDVLYELLGYCYPPIRGKSRWILLLRRVLRPRSRLRDCEIAEGVLQLDPADQNDAMYYFGVAGRAVSRLVRTIVTPGDAVIDGGANVGYISLVALGATGDSGLVYSVEANPQLARRLRGLWGARKSSQVLEAALGRHEGVVEFNIASNTGWSSTRSNPTYQVHDTITVNGVTLDSIVAGSGRDRFKLLKLDLEGGEMDALLGAANSLAESRFDCVVLETERHRAAAYGYSTAEILALFRANGYHLAAIISDEVLRRVRPGESPGDGNQDLVFTSGRYALPDVICA